MKGNVEQLEKGGVLGFRLRCDHAPTNQEVQGDGSGGELVFGRGDAREVLL